MNLIRKIRAFFISLLVAFVALEIFSYLLVRGNLLLVNDTPKLYLTENVGSVPSNWWTEQDLWGAWHKKNSVVKHRMSCFSAEYRSNSMGARDNEFVEMQAQNTFVLLGDSFAEGFGVDIDDTVQKIIENNTGSQVLNFGTAGSFGPLQYWLIYENLAKKFVHDGLIIFFLPQNDFVDNDYDFWLKSGETFLNKNGEERYRPYYKRSANGEYDHFIPTNAIKRDNFENKSSLSFIQFIVDNFWAANILKTIRRLTIQNPLPLSYSGYFDASIDQQDAAVYFIKKIVTSTSASKVIIVTIPTKEDFSRVEKGARRENIRWWSQFKELEKISAKKVQFLDLIDFKPKDVDSLFFTCDGHWSPIGNNWAAHVVSDKLLK